MDGSDHSSMTPSEGPYPASALRKTKWGDFNELDNGTWETIWTLTLRGDHAREVVEVFRSESIGFTAVIAFLGMRNAEMRVSTREHAMSAVNYPATYTSFRIVNDELAEIETIQGQPRDWYAPFRD